MARASRLAPLVALLAACALPDPGLRLETGPDARRTSDGLVALSNPGLDAVFVRPGVDFRPYRKLQAESLGVPARIERHESGGRGPLAPVELYEDDVVRMQQLFREALVESFGEVKRYQLVDRAGPGVLRLAASIVQFHMVGPSESTRAQGSARVFTQSSGSMTLVAELRDSLDGRALVRLADRRNTSSDWAPNNEFTRWADIRDAFRSWASELRRRLDELRQEGVVGGAGAGP